MHLTIDMLEYERSVGVSKREKRSCLLPRATYPISGLQTHTSRTRAKVKSVSATGRGHQSPCLGPHGLFPPE